MSNEITKEPKIRFDGYEGDWEQRKLGDILSERKIRSKISKEIPLLAFAAGQGVIDRSERKTNNRDFLTKDANTKTYLLTKYNDIVYNPSNLKYGAIDRNKYGLGVISPIYATFETNQVPEFIELIVTSYSFKQRALQYEEGTVTKRQSVKPENLLTLDVSISKTLEEQQKIGTFFQQLDNTIALHQRELDLLEQTKQTYLQKMFPKTGEDKPEIRFAGFTDAWEQRKLDEVSSIYDGTHQTPKYQDEGVMFLSVENIKTLTSNKFISRDAFESEFKIRPQKSDVLMTRIGDIGTANVVESDEDLAYYVSLALFKSENLNPYFLKASIHAPFVQDQIWKRTLHIAFPKKINKNEIGQVPINIPKFEEQVKIGKFFQEVDKAITLHQRKLDSLKEMKKTLLQKMFV